MLEIALKNGISRSTYYKRLKMGWSKEEAATKPVYKGNKYVELAQKNGLHRSTYYGRLKRGWSKEKAATTPILKKKYDGEVAVYRGDEFLMIGTIKECAEKLNLTEKAIRYSLTPTAHKENKGNALISIRLDEED